VTISPTGKRERVRRRGRGKRRRRRIISEPKDFKNLFFH